MLTAERLREVLSYAADSGMFTRRARTSNCVKVGTAAGTPHRAGYVAITIDSRAYLAHRLAWLHVHGCWPVSDIDHINGDKTDNHIANLREATRFENAQNRRSASRNNLTSGLLGVTWDKSRRNWKAQISAGKHINLGCFQTKEDAKEFRDLAAAMLHPFSPCT